MLTCWKLGSADNNNIRSKDVIEDLCGLNDVFALRLLSAFMLTVTLHSNVVGNVSQVKGVQVLVTISQCTHAQTYRLMTINHTQGPISVVQSHKKFFICHVKAEKCA